MRHMTAWYLTVFGTALSGLCALTGCVGSEGDSDSDSQAAIGTSGAGSPGNGVDTGNDQAAEPTTNTGSGADTNTTGTTGTIGTTGTTGSDATTSAADFCSGSGPVISLPTGSSTYDTCTGRIAETRFLNALCTCENATVAGYLKTRGFDSANGPATDADVGGGSVGINRTYAITSGYTDVGGWLTVAGTESLSFAGYLRVGGDLRLAGEAVVAGYTKVYGDAWLGASFTDLGPVTIEGDLHSARPVMAIPLLLSGVQTQENVTIDKPCPCEPEDLLDVDSLVDDAKLHNDNASAGIDPEMFNLLIGNVHAVLPCGRFYVERIGGVGNLIVNVTGRVALFIDGSFDATGNLEFRLDPGAEIDIFIRRNLVLTGRAVFGSKDRPAATRIYVGGDGDVLLVGAGGFVGNVYAPHSLVTAVGYAEVWGSVFAKNFLSPGYANFVYDRAIQRGGDDCDEPPPPPDTCDRCGTCTGGTACVDGECGACTSNSDCCPPLVCDEGTCIEHFEPL